jgi:acetolactate synthase-1/2/3 large subunit
LLDAHVADNAAVWPEPADFAAAPVALNDAAADAILGIIASASRPLLIAGPHLANRPGRALLARLQLELQVPTCIMESPRGFNDATLGAFNDLIRRVDLIVLLGKAFDFTLKFGEAPIDPACKFISIDPEGALVERAARETGARFAFGCVADTHPAGETLLRRAAGRAVGRPAWLTEATVAFIERPDWATAKSRTPGKLHPFEVFRELAPFVGANEDTVLICDGGEFAQWGQSVLPIPSRRMINGVGGSIGSSLPMAIASRLVEPKAPVIAVLGDGTFGFHMAEFETAARRGLPFVAIVGTDSRWNAEYNLQVRDYGRDRAVGCELTPARYDLVAVALGGHGELVEKPEDMAGAIERSLASGKPACINVMVESIASPVVRR